MTTVPTISLIDVVRFVLTRIDEDDSELRLLHRNLRRRTAVIDDVEGVRSIERQLAEIETKRHVLGLAQQLLVLRDLPADKPVRDAAAQIVREMAVPYATHQSYCAEWRPRR